MCWPYEGFVEGCQVKIGTRKEGMHLDGPKVIRKAEACKQTVKSKKKRAKTGVRRVGFRF